MAVAALVRGQFVARGPRSVVWSGVSGVVAWVVLMGLAVLRVEDGRE